MNKFNFSDDVMEALHSIDWFEDRNVDVSSLRLYYSQKGYFWNDICESFFSSFLDVEFEYGLATGIILDISFCQADLEAIEPVIAHNLSSHFHTELVPMAAIDHFQEMVFLSSDGAVYLVSSSRYLRTTSIASFFEYLIMQKPLLEVIE